MSRPQFVALQPLGAQRAWTATFSHGYYLVRLFDEDNQVQTGELVAEVSPGDVEHVRMQLAAVAASGKSNTSHAPDDDRWRPQDLEAYRAAHPFAADAVARTDRPDWGVRLAYEATSGDDRKRVLGIAAGQAVLLRGRIARFFAGITPWPFPLDVIAMWADGPDAYKKIHSYVRERIAGLFAGLILLVLGDQLVWGDYLSEGMRGLVISLAAPPLGWALSFVARFIS